MKNVLEKLIIIYVKVLYGLANSSLNTFRCFIFLRTKPHKVVKKILVFRTGNIGDVICAFPAIVAIRKNYPKAEIFFLSSPGNKNLSGAKELSSGLTVVDKIHIYSNEDINSLAKVFLFIKTIREEKCDLFIELPQNSTRLKTEFRNIIFARLVGCKYGYGFKISTIKIFAQIQSKYLKFVTEEERLLGILKKEKITSEKVNYNFQVSKSDQVAVKEVLAKLNKTPIIVFSAFSNFKARNYNTRKFAEIGRELVAKYNINIVILGGKADLEKGSLLASLIGPRAVNIFLNLPQTIEFMRHCKLVISVDSGNIHLASAAGTPSIGLFAAIYLKGQWYPFGNRNIVLRKELECHSCFNPYCAQSHCLDGVSVEEVLTAAGKILNNDYGEVKDAKS